MTDLVGIGLDLGDSLREYAGVPLNWESEYPASLAPIAQCCGIERSTDRRHRGEQLLTRYNTRRSPRPDEREFSATQIFRELLHAWGAPPETLEPCILAFFAHFRQALRVFPYALAAIARLTSLRVPPAILTDVPCGMPKQLVLSDLAAAGDTLTDLRIAAHSLVYRR